MSRASKYLQTQLKNIETRKRFASGQSSIPSPAERKAEADKKMDYIRNVKKKPADWAHAMAAEERQCAMKQMSKLNPKLKETWDMQTLNSLVEGQDLMDTEMQQTSNDLTKKKKGKDKEIIDDKMAEELTPQLVKQGIGIARDKRYAGGNMTGATKAMDKLHPNLSTHPRVARELRKQNEEIEQVDEISKQTLASYIPKAAQSARLRSQIATDFQNLSDPGFKDSRHRLAMKYKQKAAKRFAGIAKADAKLKEEVAQVDEIAPVIAGLAARGLAARAGMGAVGQIATGMAAKQAVKKMNNNTNNNANSYAEDVEIVEQHAMGDLVRCKKTNRLATVQSAEGDRYTVAYADGSTETGAADWYDAVRKTAN